MLTCTAQADPRPSVNGDARKELRFAVRPPIDNHPGIVMPAELPIVQLVEFALWPSVEDPGYRQQDETRWFQNRRGLAKRSTDWWFDVFQDFASDQEIEWPYG